MKIKSFFIISFLTLHVLILKSQSIYGYWEGKIAISKSDSLTIGLNITHKSDTIILELDSPDQFFIGQAAEFINIDSSQISFSVSAFDVNFSGKHLNTNVIEGVFSQRGKKFPLLLKKGKERKLFLRPQTPHPPFDYNIREINFKDVKNRYNLISGTLTIPKNPKALVIFISGSGWQDRDESCFGHKPFAVLSDACSRAGIATFRYDDFPLAVFQKSTTFDFSDAVNMIIDSLKAIPELKNLKKGLIGHSEGSLVAFIAASKNPEIAFTIHLSGVSQHIYDILSYQIYALSAADSSVSEDFINKSLEISQELYKVVKKSKNVNVCIDALIERWDKITQKLSEDEIEAYKMTPDKKFSSIYSLSTPWYFTLFHIEPKKYLKNVKSPVLAISGNKDLQICASDAIYFMRKYLPHNNLNKFIVKDNLNHLLQPCTTGTIDEYSKIETTISENVIKEILIWISEVVLEK